MKSIFELILRVFFHLCDILLGSKEERRAANKGRRGNKDGGEERTRKKRWKRGEETRQGERKREETRKQVRRGDERRGKKRRGEEMRREESEK